MVSVHKINKKNLNESINQSFLSFEIVTGNAPPFITYPLSQLREFYVGFGGNFS
jgi:hypothetical protein